jgi:hypothetical protein
VPSRQRLTLETMFSIGRYVTCDGVVAFQYGRADFEKYFATRQELSGDGCGKARPGASSGWTSGAHPWTD